jgi:hypothetical protein
MSFQSLREEEKVKKGLVAGYNAKIIEEDARREKDREKMAISRELDRRAYEKGEEWFKSGLTLEDADEKLKNNKSFVYGFERGKRLAFIAELKGNDQKKR